jgi:hypothetical protein
MEAGERGPRGLPPLPHIAEGSCHRGELSYSGRPEPSRGRTAALLGVPTLAAMSSGSGAAARFEVNSGAANGGAALEVQERTTWASR